jgi:hypothetical protein
MLDDLIERAERDQDTDCARIDAAIGLAEQEITALESGQLDPDEKRKKWCAIRDRTILAVRDVRHHIVRRATEARETETRMIKEWLRERADGGTLHEFSATLQDIPTNGLLDYLRYLIQIGDQARVQCIYTAFKARNDHHPYKVTFDKMFAQFALAECGDLGDRLARICRSSENADAKVAHLFCTHAATNRSRAPTSLRQVQVEAPMIDAPNVDGVPPATRAARACLLQPSSNSDAAAHLT